MEAHGGSLNKDSHLFRTLFLTHTATSEGYVCVCVCAFMSWSVCSVCLGVAPLTAQLLPVHKYGTLFPGTLHVPFPLPEHPFPSPTLIFARSSLAHSSRAGEGVFFPRKPALNTPAMAAQGTLCPRTPILASLSPCPGPVGCNLWFLCPWGPQVQDWFLSTSGSPAQAGTPSEVPIGHTEAQKMLVK